MFNTAGRAERRNTAKASCTRASGATTLTSRHARQSSRGYAAEARQRGGAQRAGIVDDEVETTEVLGGVHQGPSVGVVGDVAGDGHERARPSARRGADGSFGLGQRVAVAGVEHEAPAPKGQLLGQRPPSPLDAPVTSAMAMCGTSCEPIRSSPI